MLNQEEGETYTVSIILIRVVKNKSHMAQDRSFN